MCLPHQYHTRQPLQAPFHLFQALLSLLSMYILSGSVLAMTFWPAVREDNRRIALATIVTIVLLHMLLSVGCLVRSHSDALLVCFRCHAKTSNCQTPWFFKSWLPGINIVLNRLCREAALAWASLFQRFPASSVLAGKEETRCQGGASPERGREHT